jgi:hypothetical protein
MTMDKSCYFRLLDTFEIVTINMTLIEQQIKLIAWIDDE